MFAQRCVVVGIMLTTLGGCVTVSVGPDRVYAVDDVVGIMHAYEQGDQQHVPPGLVAALNNKTDRNNFVTERMAAIDLEYTVYYGKLTNEAQLGNASADIIALLFSTGATGFASAATKTALAAGATITNGIKANINQDVLIANTIQILQSTMETEPQHCRSSDYGKPLLFDHELYGLAGAYRSRRLLPCWDAPGRTRSACRDHGQQCPADEKFEKRHKPARPVSADSAIPHIARGAGEGTGTPVRPPRRAVVHRHVLLRNTPVSCLTALRICISQRV